MPKLQLHWKECSQYCTRLKSSERVVQQTLEQPWLTIYKASQISQRLFCRVTTDWCYSTAHCRVGQQEWLISRKNSPTVRLYDEYLLTGGEAERMVLYGTPFHAEPLTAGARSLRAWSLNDLWTNAAPIAASRHNIVRVEWGTTADKGRWWGKRRRYAVVRGCKPYSGVSRSTVMYSRIRYVKNATSWAESLT